MLKHRARATWVAGTLTLLGCSSPAASGNDSNEPGQTVAGRSNAGRAGSNAGGSPGGSSAGLGGWSSGEASGGIAGKSSGGGASGGTTSGGAANAYEPCPVLPEPCRIMPSGDSITVGAQSTDTGGYRVPLFALALQHGRAMTFVGPSGAGPATVDGVSFPDAHDGHSGYIIDTIGSRKGLAPLMAQNLAKLKPHIVLLMIGTNDLNSAVDVATAPERLAALLDTVTASAPETLLVVAQLTPTRSDALNVDVRAFNQRVASDVAARVKAGQHVALVDFYGAFTESSSYQSDWLFDGLHPNDAGYAVMARVWYAAIGAYMH